MPLILLFALLPVHFELLYLLNMFFPLPVLVRGQDPVLRGYHHFLLAANLPAGPARPALFPSAQQIPGNTVYRFARYLSPNSRLYRASFLSAQAFIWATATTMNSAVAQLRLTSSTPTHVTVSNM